MDMVEIYKKLNEKAAKDAEFKKLLLTNAKGAIKQEVGIDVPEDIQITFHENTDAKVAWVIPFYTEEKGDEDLDEEQLEQISGGAGKIIPGDGGLPLKPYDNPIVIATYIAPPPPKNGKPGWPTDT